LSSSEVVRKLTAILCSDVVGFSFMGEQNRRVGDHVRTARRRKETRRRDVPTALLFCVLLCMFPLASSQAEESAEEVSPAERSQLLWKEGTLLHLLGEYDSAIERFSRSIEILATAEAFTYRGWSLSMVGRFAAPLPGNHQHHRESPFRRAHADPQGQPLAGRQDGAAVGGVGLRSQREKLPKHPGIPGSMDAQSRFGKSKGG